MYVIIVKQLKGHSYSSVKVATCFNLQTEDHNHNHSRKLWESAPECKKEQNFSPGSGTCYSQIPQTLTAKSRDHHVGACVPHLQKSWHMSWSTKRAKLV